jgi:hypothetical protein
LLAANRDRIPHAERVEKDVDALDQEAHDADPDPERLRDTLTRIIAGSARSAWCWQPPTTSTTSWKR